MISSSDELKLLIKKWENERIQVGVLLTIKGPSGRRAASYVEGVPHLEEESDMFGVLTDGPSYVALNLSDINFGYIRSEDAPELKMPDISSEQSLFDPNKYDEYILVRWPEGSIAVILTVTGSNHI